MRRMAVCFVTSGFFLRHAGKHEATGPASEYSQNTATQRNQVRLRSIIFQAQRFTVLKDSLP